MNKGVTRNCLWFRIALLLLCAATSAALADHGGSSHSDFGLTVPSTSDTGNYTISWGAGGYYIDLEESYEGGAYTYAYRGNADSVSLSGKAGGTYLYRIHFEFCYYECTEAYSLPESIVVTTPPPTTPVEDALSALEERIDAYFFEILFAIKPDITEIQSFSDILRQSVEDQSGGLALNPDPLIIRETTVIRKVRYLQNIGTAYVQDSIYPQNRVASGYFFSLDGEVELSGVKIAGTIPPDLSVLLADYFAYQYTYEGN